MRTVTVAAVACPPDDSPPFIASKWHDLAEVEKAHPIACAVDYAGVVDKVAHSRVIAAAHGDDAILRRVDRRADGAGEVRPVV